MPAVIRFGGRFRGPVDDASVVTLDDNDGHPDVRALVEADYEIITF